MHNCKTKNTKILCERPSTVLLWQIFDGFMVPLFFMNLLESSVIQMPNIFCHVIIFPHMIYGYLKNSVSLL